ncbi:MAG: glycosyltransferase [Nitrospirae bacterium]|nr:glycosyltransferase [Nitrospirota bacterium]
MTGSKLKVISVGPPKAIAPFLDKVVELRKILNTCPQADASEGWRPSPGLGQSIADLSKSGFEADLILFWSPFANDYSDWEKVDRLQACFWEDIAYSFPWQSSMARLFDANIVELTDLSSFYPNGERPLAYCPLAFPGDAAHARRFPPETERPHDVAFVGNLDPASKPQRADFFRRLEGRLAGRFRVFFGRGQVEDVFARAKIVCNFSTRPTWAYLPSPACHLPHNLGINPRTFEAMGFGAMLLTDSPSPELHRLFREGEHFVTYEHLDVDGAVAQIEKHLSEPPRRLAVARAGWLEIQRAHTYDVRAGHLAGILAEIVAGGRRARLPLNERRFLLGLALLRQALHDPSTADSASHLYRHRISIARRSLTASAREAADPRSRAMLPLFDAIEGRPQAAAAGWTEIWQAQNCTLAATGLEVLLRWAGHHSQAEAMADWRRARLATARSPFLIDDELRFLELLFIVFQRVPRDSPRPASELFPQAPPFTCVPVPYFYPAIGREFSPPNPIHAGVQMGGSEVGV